MSEAEDDIDILDALAAAEEAEREALAATSLPLWCDKGRIYAAHEESGTRFPVLPTEGLNSEPQQIMNWLLIRHARLRHLELAGHIKKLAQRLKEESR